MSWLCILCAFSNFSSSTPCSGSHCKLIASFKKYCTRDVDATPLPAPWRGELYHDVRRTFSLSGNKHGCFIQMHTRCNTPCASSPRSLSTRNLRAHAESTLSCPPTLSEMSIVGSLHSSLESAGEGRSFAARQRQSCGDS